SAMVNAAGLAADVYGALAGQWTGPRSARAICGTKKPGGPPRLVKPSRSPGLRTTYRTAHEGPAYRFFVVGRAYEAAPTWSMKLVISSRCTAGLISRSRILPAA